MKRQPLPLSDAAQQLLENPPSAEKAITKDSENEDDYLDIPSFVKDSARLIQLIYVFLKIFYFLQEELFLYRFFLLLASFYL